MLALPYKKFDYSFQGDFTVGGKPLFLSSPNAVRDAQDAVDGDTGNAVWDAAVLLVKYMESNPSIVANENTVELGCGLGLCGIAAAMLGAKHVSLTDMDYILPTVQHNIKTNSLSHLARGVCLDWTRPEQSSIDWRNVDLVISSDTLWLAHLIAPLVSTLKLASCLNPNVSIIISNQRRSEATWDKFCEFIQPDFILTKLVRDGVLEVFSLKIR